ncbi:MAG: hypothetical protein ACM3Q2_18735 [Syntrophothermus sp.]
MKVTAGTNSFLAAALKDVPAAQQMESKPQVKSDSIEISNTSRAFDKLDKFLNLGNPDRLDLEDLNSEEKKEFMKMLAALIKKGIVGYEVLEVNGKPEKHYIVNEIGDSRIYKAKLYRKKDYYSNTGRTRP